MGKLYFAIGSLIFLFPILYFMPIGLSKKGKATVMGSAFLIAALALLTTPLFPLWQTILISILLIGTTTYFYHSKFSSLLYALEESFDDFEEETFSKSSFEGFDEAYSHIALADKSMKLKDFEVDEEEPIINLGIKPEPSLIKIEVVEDLNAFNEAAIAKEDNAVVDDADSFEDRICLQEIEEQLENDNSYLEPHMELDEMEIGESVANNSLVFEEEYKALNDQSLYMEEIEREYIRESSIEDEISAKSFLNDILEEENFGGMAERKEESQYASVLENDYELPVLSFDKLPIQKDEASKSERFDSKRIESELEEIAFYRVDRDALKETGIKKDKLEIMWERVGLVKE